MTSEAETVVLSRRRSFQQGAWTVALGATLVVAVCLAVGSWVRAMQPRFPDTPTLPEKIDYLKSVADQVDLVILGSSRVYRDFVPEVLDRQMSELGCPVRSYNLGIPGLTFAEAQGVLNELENARSTPFPWVLLGDMQSYRARGRASRRSRYFAGSDLFAIAWQDIGTAPLIVPANQRALRQDLLRVYVNELFATGSLSDLLNPIPQAEQTFEYFLPVNPGSEQGFLTVEVETAPAFAARRDRFLAKPPTLKTDAGPDEQRGTNVPQEVFDRRARFIERRLAGTRPIAERTGFIMFPRSRHEYYSAELKAAATRIGIKYPMINLNSPEQHPVLADVNVWYDYGHLTEEGARAITGVLAKELCAMMKPG